jgi:hypothetical protein
LLKADALRFAALIVLIYELKGIENRFQIEEEFSGA